MPEDENGELPRSEDEEPDNPDEWRDVCDDPDYESG